MKVLTLCLILSLISSIFGATSCGIFDANISSFANCQEYSTSSTSKLCCYVHGEDFSGNKLSGCEELTGTTRGAYQDIYMKSLLYKNYLDADCNFGKEISICDPNFRKSNTPLSPEICSKSIVAPLGDIDEDDKCCYVTGISVDKKNVYSCVGIGNSFNTESYEKEQIEKGYYQKLGPLNNVNIECYSKNYYLNWISIIFIIFGLINYLY